MSEIIKCENCGSVMQPFKRRCSVGMECPNCGWNWVTTFNEPIDEDETKYSLKVDKIDNPTMDAIKTISKLLNSNFIETKKLIENNEVEFKGKARKIKEYKDSLDEKGLSYKINPEFPY